MVIKSKDISSIDVIPLTGATANLSDLAPFKYYRHTGGSLILNIDPNKKFTPGTQWLFMGIDDGMVINGAIYLNELNDSTAPTTLPILTPGVITYTGLYNDVLNFDVSDTFEAAT